eukprot:361974-Chlamydomonas_euryale.AAC.5
MAVPVRVDADGHAGVENKAQRDMQAWEPRCSVACGSENKAQRDMPPLSIVPGVSTSSTISRRVHVGPGRVGNGGATFVYP